mmetsp:Transcript_11326/g.25771  ORF Transcript_11326/g.25771 Transcript_11326/m.25771 type:complete len:102 (+) Transcript_11326:107-412(+)
MSNPLDTMEYVVIDLDDLSDDEVESSIIKKDKEESAPEALSSDRFGSNPSTRTGASTDCATGSRTSRRVGFGNVECQRIPEKKAAAVANMSYGPIPLYFRK